MRQDPSINGGAYFQNLILNKAEKSRFVQSWAVEGGGEKALFRAGSARAALPPEGLAAGVLLTVLVVLAWALLFRMDAANEIFVCRVSPTGFTALGAMWVVMMVAMMTPSALPMILSYAQVAARHEPSAARLGLVGVFAGLYFLVWSVFALLGAAAQWGLSEKGLLQDGKLSEPLLAGALVLIAGLYQLTAVKAVCLRHCHAPSAFLAGRYRPGFRGAARLGLEHAMACVGCCWLLMLLAFAGSSMHLGWMVALTLFVAIEKLVGARGSALRFSAILLIGAGAAHILTSGSVLP